MDIKWKDFEGNILNADEEKIIYLNAKENKKTIIKKQEVKKIVIEDGLMHIFKDFKDDLVISIVIPKKNKRNSVKIFNEYDKTGTVSKRQTNNFLLDLILESSITTGNPLFGIIAIVISFSVVFLIIANALEFVFGDYGIVITRLLLFGFIGYSIVSYILVRLKRKRIKEI